MRHPTIILLALGTILGAWTSAHAQCPAAPDVGCRAAELSQLTIRSGTPTQSVLTWKWNIGDSFSQGDLGDPASTTDYLLCVYDSTASVFSLAATLTVPANPAWIDRDPRGWKYSDKLGTFDGVRKVELKPGDSGRTSVKWQAKGASVPLPPAASSTRFFSQDPGVVVQLQKQSGSGPSSCWTSGEFGDGDTSRNDPAGFKATNR